MQGQDAKVEGRAGMADGRERWVGRPAAAEAGRARSALREQRQDHQGKRRDDEPERDVVEAREGHVRCADHQRHEPIAEAADQGRHDDEEHHDEAVAGHEDVVGLRVGEVLQAGFLKL